MKIKFYWCDGCKGWAILCPRCGNNTCNGSYGEDGKCPVCSSCYELINKIHQNSSVENNFDKVMRIYSENKKE